MAKKTKLLRGSKTIAWRMAKDKATIDQISDKIQVIPSMIWPYLARRFREAAIDIWSVQVREEADGKCVICGKTNVNAHHLISKASHPHLALEKNNGLCLCEDHHLFNREIAGHGSTHVCDNLTDWLFDHKRPQWRWYQEHKHDKSYRDIDFEAEYWRLCQKKS